MTSVDSLDNFDPSAETSAPTPKRWTPNYEASSVNSVQEVYKTQETQNPATNDKTGSDNFFQFVENIFDI